MSRVYWDSMLFIYLFERHPIFGPRVERILSRMGDRDDVLCTSTFSLGEVLTGAVKEGELEKVEAIRNSFASLVELIPFGEECAHEYAHIRARQHVSAADAIHLASAAYANADVFLTNDSALVGKTVPGIQFIVGLNTDLF